MADVIIVAKSLTGEQKVITNEKGQFVIPSIPDGTYTLRFEKNNYKFQYQTKDGNGLSDL